MEARMPVNPSARVPHTAGPGPQGPAPVRTMEGLVWGLVYGGLVSLLGWGLFLRWLLPLRVSGSNACSSPDPG